jgi:cardiolipin synthase
MIEVLAVALAIVAAFFGYILWGKSRRRPVDVQIPEGMEMSSLLETLAALTWGRVIDGNELQVIQNSAFFDSLLADVDAARHHVHLETFLWRDGVVSERVSGVLAAAARRGVEVRILVDQRGAKQTDAAVWERLRAAGCDFRVFHRARLREFAWYNHRDHRKIAVIDGEIAYTFGHGIADMWGGSPAQPAGWRDTAARIRGPAVTELQGAFFDNWARTSAPVPAGPDYFRSVARAGSTPLHVAFIAPRETVSAVQRLYYLGIAAARRTIVLQNPYFIPDRQALKLFAAARARGVEITIMLPTSTTSDFSIVQHASHYYYGPLLRLGVRIFEYTRSGLHQKVLIVDDAWCSIGSTNFDPRSFRINAEITVGIGDPDIARELRRAFEADLADADEWTQARWGARPLGHRFKDVVSSWASRQL